MKRETLTLTQDELDELAKILDEMRHRDAVLIINFLQRKINAQNARREAMNDVGVPNNQMGAAV